MTLQEAIRAANESGTYAEFNGGIIHADICHEQNGTTVVACLACDDEDYVRVCPVRQRGLIASARVRLARGQWFMMENTPFGQIWFFSPCREDVLQHIEELTY